MFENTEKEVVKGKCPYCKEKVLEFLGCYVCQGCHKVWSKGLKEWERDHQNSCICKNPRIYLKDNQSSPFCGICGKPYNGYVG